ncbi:MAG: hypothetical protein ACJ73E_11905 [Mycobacteriales bacterium]
MSLSSTSSSSRSATGQRAVRAAAATAVAVVLLTPVAVLFAQVWWSTGGRLSFVADERRGVAYLGPLTRLLSVATQAQSDAVARKPVDTAAVRSAIAAVDEIDGRLGARLRTTERWSTIRGLVQQRTGRAWTRPAEAYTQYSDVVTQLMELNRKVGDGSRLILDPELDAYYVMNAAALRIPEILVDSGRYTDLSVLSAASGLAEADSLAQLTAARNRVATNATDLSDGLVKAFGDTTSTTLGPGLTRPLDDFRTAVDAVAPSNSLLAPPPQRSQIDLRTDQDRLQRDALTLQEAALGELDRLLSDRQGDTRRARLVAVGAALLGVVLAGVAVVELRRSRAPTSADPSAGPRGQAGPGQAGPGQPGRGQPGRGQGVAGPAGPAWAVPGQVPAGPAPGLVGAGRPEQRGGARAAR